MLFFARHLQRREIKKLAADKCLSAPHASICSAFVALSKLGETEPCKALCTVVVTKVENTFAVGQQQHRMSELRLGRGVQQWVFPIITQVWTLKRAEGGESHVSFDKAKQFRWLLFSQITVVHHAGFSLIVQVRDVNISLACWSPLKGWKRDKTNNNYA